MPRERGEIPLEERVANAEAAAAGGNVDIVNFTLARGGVPRWRALDILANAYERRAEIVSAPGADKKAGKAWLVPHWELGVVGDRAIAYHLRQLAADAQEKDPK